MPDRGLNRHVCVLQIVPRLWPPRGTLRSVLAVQKKPPPSMPITQLARPGTNTERIQRGPEQVSGPLSRSTTRRPGPGELPLRPPRDCRRLISSAAAAPAFQPGCRLLGYGILCYRIAGCLSLGCLSRACSRASASAAARAASSRRAAAAACARRPRRRCAGLSSLMRAARPWSPRR